MSSYSAVPRIELNLDNTISIMVRVDGIKVGTPVEISGNVTQENGAVATFYTVQNLPDDRLVWVKSESAVEDKKFDTGFPITVVARAAEAWVAILREDESSESKQSMATPADSDTLQGSWKLNSAEWAVYPSAPASAPAETASTLLRHGTWWDLKKVEPLDTVAAGRFTRLFPYLPGARFKEGDLKQLARAMIAPLEQPEPGDAEEKDDPEENKTIPAAYTYLGQFVDHDLTFDPTSQLRKALSPAQLKALVDFRTPRFDLDNLYGRGPDDQPYMYEDDGIHLLPGEHMLGDPFDPGAVQLPRGPNGRALIGDPRNDENRIVAQLHAIFLRFHNEVVDRLGGKKNVSFQEVRQLVQWHYQWMLVKDFLPKIVEQQTYESVFSNPYRPVTTIPRLRENDLELMPVEFSVAAYRFGHSMIRSQYRLNPKIERPIPIFSDDPDDDTADLGGFRPIPADWAIDWRFFIGLDPGDEPQLSYKIDTSLVHPLGHLPARIAKDPSSLALRNLERGLTFQLPSGQRVAEALGFQPIANEDLMIGKATTDTRQKSLSEVVPGFGSDAPLWTYILSEAQVTSWENAGPVANKNAIPIRLGPVGGRLVAEVFASLLRGDPTSYLNAKTRFEPIAALAPGGTFGLAELINVALGRTH